MKNQMLVAVVCAAAAGCASSPEQLAAQSDLDVCRSFGTYKNGIIYGALADKYKQEILRRNALTPDDLATAESRKVKQGMSLCALYASWGNPSKENRSVGSWGTHIQHIYNAGYTYVKPTYVYTRNGRVSSWQD